MLKFNNTYLNLFILLFFIVFTFNSCKEDNLLNNDEIEWLKNSKELKVATFNGYPPYQFRNSEGEMHGIFIDYLSLIEEKINYKFTRIEYEDWPKVLEDAKNNKIDLILEIQKTKPRTSYLDFHNALFDSQIVIITRENDIQETSFSEIKHKRIVIPRNYYIEDVLKKAHPEINLFYEKNETDCLLALSNGKYDAYLGSDSNTTYFIEANNIKNLTISAKAPFKYRPTIGTVKNNKMLNHIMDKAVNSISILERDEIFSKWVQKKYFPTIYKPDFWFLIIPFAFIILLASLYFNWSLKKKVAERTADLNTALIKANKTSCIKTNFLQNISHEIRTPMNGILGFSELLKKQGTTPEEQSEYINTIINSGKDLVHIVDNILEISDLQSDEHTINPEFVNLNEVFENITALFKPNATKKGIQLTYKKDNRNEELIFTDKLRLIKILKNIIGNAVKFTKDGEVIIFYKKQNSKLEIQVSDTGTGIKKSKQNIIFNEFLKLEEKNSKKVSGIGLGLAVAKRNALILGGEISFTSEENNGSTFIINLPCLNANNENTESVPDETIKENENTYQILIAEDEEINFMLVNSVLSRFEPYEFLITRAINGQEAVDIFKENDHIDLVLMDIRMPIMDGYEATSIIKKLNPSVPVIAHTAYSSDKDIHNALEAGCDSVICKPINLKEFKQTIINHIN